MRGVLGRAPDFAQTGRECWGRVSIEEATAIIETAYANGASSEELAHWLVQFPPETFWWIVEHDF